MERFDFISPTVSNGDMTRPWSKFSDHIGPTEHVTPLGERVAGKTYCGLLSLAAGTTAWCAHRMSGKTDVSSLFHLVEVIFAFQNDWRYFDRAKLPFTKVPSEPMERSFIVGVEMAVRNFLNPKIFWKSGRVPDTPVFHLSHVVGYIMPKSEFKKFESWFYAASDRLDELAKRPLQRVLPKGDYQGKDREADLFACHGVPFPPDVLDVSKPFEMDERENNVMAFLASLDWERNPFLASPTDMRDAGYKGEPYVD